jgi:hypothetical protein
MIPAHNSFFFLFSLILPVEGDDQPREKREERVDKVSRLFRDRVLHLLRVVRDALQEAARRALEVEKRNVLTQDSFQIPAFIKGMKRRKDKVRGKK